MQIEVERLGPWNIGQVVTVESDRDGSDTQLTGILESVEKGAPGGGVYLSVAGDEFFFSTGGTVDVRRGVELGAMTKLDDDLHSMAQDMQALMERTHAMHVALTHMQSADTPGLLSTNRKGSLSYA